jgi:hypothetical protein
MEVHTMRRIRQTSTFLVLTLAVLLSGCSSSGIGDILGGGSRTDDPYRNVTNVRGTIERVDTRERYIVVNSEDTQYNLRNGQGGEVLVYYDDRTTVEHQGGTYRPQDLEPGDRILADVNDSGGRLFAEEIQVLYDVTSGTSQDDRYGQNDPYSDNRTSELRGTVRNNDTRNRTLEVEASRYGSSFSSGQGDVVVVRYDANTVVEFEGRRYTPDNLERGDLVEIEVRNLGGEMIAQEILVVGENQPIGSR